MFIKIETILQIVIDIQIEGEIINIITIIELAFWNCYYTKIDIEIDIEIAITIDIAIDVAFNYLFPNMLLPILIMLLPQFTAIW